MFNCHNLMEEIWMGKVTTGHPQDDFLNQLPIQFDLLLFCALLHYADWALVGGEYNCAKAMGCVKCRFGRVAR